MSTQKSTSNTFIFILILILFMVNCWVSSGSLAIYGLTSSRPIVSDEGYLLNLDDPHFKETFALLDGTVTKTKSVVLRRILYPLYSYFFVKTFGWITGGFIANVLLGLLSLCLVYFSAARRGKASLGLTIAFLLACYPGYMYWIGMPYAYAAIVPVSIFGYLLLARLHDKSTLLQIVATILLLGILCITYDFYPFFFGTLFIIFFLKKYRWYYYLTLPLLFVPMVVNLYIQWRYFRIPVKNDNTEVYSTIFLSYFDREAYQNYSEILLAFPEVLFTVFLTSNFIFYPLLFLLLVVLNLRYRFLSLQHVDIGWALSTLALFSILNLAPAYEGWQMRGVWIARIYQPLFPVLIWVIGRAFVNEELLSGAKSFILRPLFTLFLIGNLAIIWSPMLRFELGTYSYYYFYKAGKKNRIIKNIYRYGRYPLGTGKISQKDHTVVR